MVDTASYLKIPVPAVVLGDSGPDACTLSFDIYNKVLEVRSNLSEEVLDPPTKVTLAVKASEDESKQYTASRIIRLSITITLPGSKLPLRIHRVPFYVLGREMDDVILGRDLLKKIGFNLNENLKRVPGFIREKEYDDVNPNDINIS